MREKSSNKGRLRSCRWLLVAFLLPGGPGLQGAVNVLSTLAEDQVANGNCTLREAILATVTGADVDQCDGDAGPDTIVLGVAGTYEFDDGDLAPIPAGRDLTVRGAAALPRSAYVIDLALNQRFARFSNGTALRLEHLEITRGYGFPEAANLGGGAIYAAGGDLVLRDVRISDCSALHGGAIETEGSGTVDLESVEFADNRADIAGGFALRYGGALRIVSFGNTPIRLVDLRFAGNAVVDPEAGHVGLGGGMAIYSGSGGNLTLRHLSYEGNWIDVDGFGSGAGAHFELEGAGGVLDASDLEFIDNRLVTPTTNDSAAALFLDVEGFGSATIRRLSAVANGSGTTVSQVALIVGTPTAMVLADSLIADGGGPGLTAQTNVSPASLLLGNLTVTGHPGNGLGLMEGSSTTLRLENSIVYGNGLVDGKDVFLFGTDVDLSPENLIAVDPSFVDPASGDFRLAEDSVALDAGDSTFVSVGSVELDHAPRVVGADVDLGAFERGGIFADSFDDGDALAWSD